MGEEKELVKFKRLDEEKIDKFLTVRTTEAHLKIEKKEGREIKTLEAIIEKNAEVMTTSSERDKHRGSMGDEKERWFKKKLEQFEDPENKDDVTIADPDHPLEIFTGDVSLLLEIENKKYYLFICRDINPRGWLIPGGCPENRNQLLDPKSVAERECGEEVGILDKKRKIFYFLYLPKKKWKENYRNWLKLINKKEIKPKEITKLKPDELSSEKGNAQNLFIKMGDKENTENVNVYINPKDASVYIILYRKVVFRDAKISDLVFFDMELNRPVRLFTEEDIKNRKLPHGIFVYGQDILSVGFSNPEIINQITAS